MGPGGWRERDGEGGGGGVKSLKKVYYKNWRESCGSESASLSMVPFSFHCYSVYAFFFPLPSKCQCILDKNKNCL